MFDTLARYELRTVMTKAVTHFSPNFRAIAFFYVMNKILWLQCAHVPIN